jgi:hypothetical protein
MTAWDLVRGRVEAGDAERTGALVLTLTVEEGREVAEELPGGPGRRVGAAVWRVFDQKVETVTAGDLR